MEVTKAYRRPQLDPLAPVMGGGRWRTLSHQLLDLCRLDKGLTVSDPDAPIPTDPDAYENEAAAAPHIGSTPPTEARVGEECVYQARAFDSDTDGFTWYFEKSVPGMQVDRHTGEMRWTPTEGGSVEVVLCARSVFGAVARQAWTICVRKPAARKSTINRRFSEAARRKNLRKIQPIRFLWHAGRRQGIVFHRALAPPAARPRAAMPLRV